MAVGAGHRDVSRRRRSRIRVTSDTAAAADDVRHVLYEHAGRSDQRRDAHRITKTARGREGIVLTWGAPPTKGPFSSRMSSSSLRAISVQLVAICRSALTTI